MPLDNNASTSEAIALLRSLSGINNKAELVTRLTALGITASESESIAALIGKVKASSIPNLASNLKEGTIVGDVTGTLKPLEILAGVNQLYYDSTLRYVQNTSWTKLSPGTSSIKIKYKGTYRIGMNVANGSGGGTVYARFYINRGGISTPVAVAHGSGGGGVDYEDDIALEANDIIEFWGYSPDNSQTRVQAVWIKASIGPFAEKV